MARSTIGLAVLQVALHAPASHKATVIEDGKAMKSVYRPALTRAPRHQRSHGRLARRFHHLLG